MDAAATQQPAAAGSTASRAAFAVGDVVRLKSGGPKMVIGQAFTNHVNCFWIPETGERAGMLQQSTVPVETVEKAK